MTRPASTHMRSLSLALIGLGGLVVIAGAAWAWPPAGLLVGGCMALALGIGGLR